MCHASSSSSRRLSVAALALGLFVIAPAARSNAQNRFPGHGADLLGIYPGMPAEQARATLQGRSASFKVQDGLLGLSLSVLDSAGSDHIEVNIVGPPNPPVVWSLSRSQAFDAQRPVSLSALLSGLHAKYGTESYSKETGTQHAYRWLWDRDGNPLPANDPRMRTLVTQCGASWLTNSAFRGDAFPSTPELKTCYSSFIGLIVSATTNGPLVMSYDAELANMPIGYQAAVNIQNARNAATRKAQQDQINKANQNKPTF